MANKNRNKGNYHERKIVEELKAKGFEARRQPLSGSLGGEFRGDIDLKIKGERWLVEVKYRDKSNFPNPFNVLENKDLGWYKKRSGEQIVIMTAENFYKLMGV